MEKCVVKGSQTPFKPFKHPLFSLPVSKSGMKIINICKVKKDVLNGLNGDLMISTLYREKWT